MSFTKIKLLLQNPWYVFCILTFLYFLTRLINLEIIPIFNDESTYIRYGIHQILEPEFKPYSLLIGKEPLLPQLFGSLGNAMGDYLVGARVISVLFGFLTLSGLFALALKLENKKTALFVGILYLLSPFNLFFDRLALLDSAISAIAIWSLYFTYAIISKPNWWNAVYLGIVLGIGLYIKTTAFFFLGLVGFSSLLILISDKRIAKNNLLVSLNLFLSLGIALILYVPLYFSEYYAIHLNLLKQYTYPLTYVFSFPVKVWFLNLEKTFIWLVMFLTIPIFTLGIYGLVKNIKNLKYLFIMFWLIIPLIYEILYAKLFSGRHILLLTIPLIFFAAWTLYYLSKKRKQLFIFSLSVVLLVSLFYNFLIIFKPYELKNYYLSHAREDIESYFSGFASGYGVIESINYLKELSRRNPIIVMTRNDHGNPEDAVVAYLTYEPNITVVLVSSADQARQVYDQVDGARDIYFVTRGAYYLGLENNLKNEKKFLKPDGKDFVGVYKLEF